MSLQAEVEEGLKHQKRKHSWDYMQKIAFSNFLSFF